MDFTTYNISAILLATQIYGERYVEGGTVLSELTGLFVGNTDSEARIDSWRSRILSLLEHLYDSGILLRSLYDIEVTKENQTERKYNNSHKLYLSPRGKCLYDLLSGSAVLLELYRDDIYTDLDNNDKLTSQLSTESIFDYLIKYIYVLFQYEKKNISSAISNIEKYQELIGNEFVTVILLKGVIKNLRAYYKNDEEAYYKFIDKACAIRNEMKQYSKDFSEMYGIHFSISNELLEI